jgi:uncharacterized protein (TIGR03790 family)
MTIKMPWTGNCIGGWIVFLLLFGSSFVTVAMEVPGLFIPYSALTNQELAVIVNDADPLSVRIAEYYQQQRQIPEAQLIHIRFNPGVKTLSVAQFKQLKQQVDSQTPEHVQAFALTWMQPYRVGCMSITMAFTAGYDEGFCATGCKPTRGSPFYNSNREKPFKAYRWRITMALAGEDFAQVKALIDRGVAADFTNPSGTAYLLKTSDISRSSRSLRFFKTAHTYKGLWDVNYLEQDYIENKTDVMFYFTGLTHVPKIFENSYLPGAIADHLTSTGGVLSGSEQMSALEWLKAGATGSYGAVIEPCNFVQKFPHPGILMYFYLRGSTLIEAYWKSVAWPGQGIFIGEPLARPFAYQ